MTNDDEAHRNRGTTFVRVGVALDSVSRDARQASTRVRETVSGLKAVTGARRTDGMQSGDPSHGRSVRCSSKIFTLPRPRPRELGADDAHAQATDRKSPFVCARSPALDRGPPRRQDSRLRQVSRARVEWHQVCDIGRVTLPSGET
eukprot:Amastigsp_a512540_42.p1 type:complete len:146 gc:universal Amastigsp_a512540_42:759-322(-)